MPTLRISHDDQLELAIDDLVDLSSRVDLLHVVKTGPDQVSFHGSDGSSRPVRVLALDSVGESEARHLVETEARGHKVVVANKISEPARELIASHGWSWLDRRIGAHLGDGTRDIEVVFVARIDEAPDSSGVVRLSLPASDGPIRGRAGIAYAAALLCRPDDPPSLRSVAAAVGMSPTSLSNAAKQLAKAGLVGSNGRPTCPELFNVLAEVWRPLKALPVGTVPSSGDVRLHTRADRLEGPGWALGGDLAALELGAPLFNVDDRPWFWVPTQVELRRAERTLGPVKWGEQAATIAVAATPLVCQMRGPSDTGDWPIVHPVFAALELARDPGRGVDILHDWTPEGVRVVWR